MSTGEDSFRNKAGLRLEGASGDCKKKNEPVPTGEPSYMGKEKAKRRKGFFRYLGTRWWRKGVEGEKEGAKGKIIEKGKQRGFGQNKADLGGERSNEEREQGGKSNTLRLSATRSAGNCAEGKQIELGCMPRGRAL